MIWKLWLEKWWAIYISWRKARPLWYLAIRIYLIWRSFSWTLTVLRSDSNWELMTCFLDHFCFSHFPSVHTHFHFHPKEAHKWPVWESKQWETQILEKDTNMFTWSCLHNNTWPLCVAECVQIQSGLRNQKCRNCSGSERNRNAVFHKSVCAPHAYMTGYRYLLLQSASVGGEIITGPSIKL